MKKYIWSLLLVMMMVSGCGTVSRSSVKNKMMRVQKGMTKKEVTQLLGSPDYRRFDAEVEEWEYKFYFIGLEKVGVFIVMFEEERVSELNSFDTYERRHSHSPVQLQVGAEINMNH